MAEINYQKTYQSFAGCDMVASISAQLPNGKTVHQTIGSIQTITYSVFMDKKPVRSLGNVNAKDYVFGPRTIAGTLIFTVFNKHWFYELLANNGIDPSEANYVIDELPPFNISISFSNEYGISAREAIYGVRIVSEGMTLSINDVYTENTYQFVATGLDYLTDAKTVSNNKTIAVAQNKNGSVSGAVKVQRVTGTNAARIGTQPIIKPTQNTGVAANVDTGNNVVQITRLG